MNIAFTCHNICPGRTLTLTLSQPGWVVDNSFPIAAITGTPQVLPLPWPTPSLLELSTCSH